MKKLVLLALLPAVLLAQPGARNVLDSFTVSRFKSRVAFLSDDRLEGREAGTRGYDLAAKYVASEMRSFGVAPGGVNGSYFQAIPLRKAEIIDEGSGIDLMKPDRTKRELKIREDFVLAPNYALTEAEASGQVVFVGFGIVSPEQKHDDYAGIDVKGKIVAFVSGGPKSFPASLRAHFASTYTKQEIAAARGAIGTFTIRSKSSAATYSWPTLVRQGSRSGMRWIGPDGAPGRTVRQIVVGATLSKEGTAALLDGSGLSADEVIDLENATKKIASRELPYQATIRVRSKHESLSSDNVVGRIEGSDPVLRHEVLVYTAHLDHLGITSAVNGDSINNGAMDNATGIAALLEVAHAFAALPVKPKRSVMFVALTAEEKGLLGSDYFAQYPTVPRASLVANMNMDMFLMLYPFKDSLVLGYEHSTLSRAVDRAAKEMGLKLIPDPAPQENSFVRSDQYSFVREGIPAIAVNEGVDSGDPSKPGAVLLEEWRKARYHQPSDDMTQPIVWEAGVKFAKFNFLIGQLVANATERPRWNDGDFFGKTFGKKTAPKE